MPRPVNFFDTDAETLATASATASTTAADIAAVESSVAALAPVASSGDYADLTGTPTPGADTPSPFLLMGS